MALDVVIVPCERYEDQEVEDALRAALAPMDGLDFVQPGMRVAVKVNLVTAMKPDTAAVVHPSVVCALVRLLREKGAAEVVVGDSPGGVYSAGYLKLVYDVCGLRGAVEKAGGKLNDDFTQMQAEYPEAVQAKQFPYTAYLAKADAVIDLCKLKTHGMMGLSCAVKNLFGVIPGTIKPEFHYHYPKADDFADMLVDLYEYVKPRLCICDAVVGMEGNGPTQGTPRKIGCLLAAKSGHALDLVAAQLIGLGVNDIPTLAAAQKRGLIPAEAGALRVQGDPARFTVSDYQTVPSQSNVFFNIFGSGPIGKAVNFVVGRILTPFPKLSPAACVGCKKCAGICPAKAITMVRGKPKIDRGKCIHCFCCQEFCPKGAMQVGRHLLVRLIGK